MTSYVRNFIRKSLKVFKYMSYYNYKKSKYYYINIQCNYMVKKSNYKNPPLEQTQFTF